MPAYNEEKRIMPVLKNYYSHFKKKFEDNFEIIVVPNNCTDNTAYVVNLFSKNNPEVKVFDIPYYVGKGGAVMRGFEIAKGDYIGFVDADKSTSPREFFKLYDKIDNFHGVIASRKIKGAIIYPKRKLTQDFFSMLFNLKTRILFGLKYKDTQCGAKLFRKDIAKFLTRNYSESGWIFDVDLLYLCKKNKIRILEQPIFWTDHVQDSKLSFFDGIKSALKLLKYRIKTL
jgi:glycosyltransferase involved in cell wall biosynthesis